jgi:hypothetical protein
VWPSRRSGFDDDREVGSAPANAKTRTAAVSAES